jgi:beta-lactam-binding protein with PASTA domain
MVDRWFSFKVDVDAILEDVVEALRPGPPSRARVPSVVGMGVQDATHEVAKLGLKVRTVMLTRRPQPVEGKVAEQEPPPGTKLRRGRLVTLYLTFPTEGCSP